MTRPQFYAIFTLIWFAMLAIIACLTPSEERWWAGAFALCFGVLTCSWMIQVAKDFQKSEGESSGSPKANV